MKIEHDKQNIRVEVESGELVIRIPIRVVFEEVTVQGFGTAIAPLTKREEECLKKVLQAKSNKEIADDMKVCERTVKFHVSSILAKHKISSRYELGRIYSESIRVEKENGHGLGS